MKIGILTFHYSNNYGGVLQCYALQETIKKMGHDVDVINFVPSSYDANGIFSSLGLSKNPFKNKNMNISDILKVVKIKKKNNRKITNKFEKFRENYMNLSNKVDESSLDSIIDKYNLIITGSDQVWNPSQRKNREYFLDFKDKYTGSKISYAADSTIADVDDEDKLRLEKVLNEYNCISVRNEHSRLFVENIIKKDCVVVADPTLLHDFSEICELNNNEEYILTYILGKEIDGTHKKTIEKIKERYGDIPVYAIVIPNMNFKIYDYADKTYYDLDPKQWITMFKNAKFIYTDSFHGVLFSLKFHKPFLAYYTENLRSTRFIDLKNRYNIDRFIVESVYDIDKKESLKHIPSFDKIDIIISEQVKVSREFLNKALKCNI